MTTYTLKVVEIRKETQDTLTLCFKQPALRKIKYLAGQYLTLIFRINGRRYIRPYSFSSAPSVDQLLEVTIKRVPNGIVSNHIHDRVFVGDTIEAMQPMGDFICEAPTDQIFLWGIGSGITPLMSISKQVLSVTTKTRVNLVYGNKNYENTIFLNQLKSLLQLYPERFIVKYFHSSLKISEQIPELIEGRIDQKKALDVLNELHHSCDTIHYICGPPGLKESVKKALKLRNVSEDQVFSEDFELVKDPKDFEDVFTQTIKLKFGSEEFALEVIRGKSILEGALDAGIELPYSCQTGSCSTCKGKLLKGEARMIGLTRDRNDLLADEYLVCCTHPLSNNVYIEIG